MVHDSGDNTRIRWIRFIYRNSGWGVINDDNTNPESVLAPVNALADEMASPRKDHEDVRG